MLAASLSCAGRPPPRPTLAQLPTTAAWLPRALDPSKDVVVRADLLALRASPGLAPAVEEGLLSAIDRSLGGGPNLRAALAGASEALVAFLPDGEPLVLFRGVPSELDPASLRALDGGAQWEPGRGTWPGVAEYNYRPASGSLFVLPDGTWVIGAGTAAQRVKNAFSETGGAPILPARDAHPALELRVPGAALGRIAREKRVQRLEAVLVPALDLTIVLEAGNEAVATLVYPDAPRALEAERVLRETAEAFGRRGRSLAWLGGAAVTRADAVLRVQVAVPPTVFGDLSGSDR
jgi:hypothetical protein